MCLETRQRRPRVAKEDITVYKNVIKVYSLDPILVVVDGKVRNAYPITHFEASIHKKQYAIGRTYSVPKLGYSFGEVNEGFHSYKHDYEAKSQRSGEVTVECIIPKGALYFEGRNNGTSDGYCSTKLKIVKVIEG
jgi:hypothetical protein